MTFKEKVYQRFLQVMNNKISLLQQNLDSLSFSARNETKRTAGDKHATALAMLQIEQENLRSQLNEAKNQQSVIQKLDPAVMLSRIGPGALVKTSQGFFFISIAIGKIREEGIEVISLSLQSPLGSRLYGLVPGQELILNTRSYFIEEVS